MQTLQNAIEDAVGRIPEEVLTHILAPKLKSQGIALSKKEQRKLLKHILEGRSASLDIRSWQFWKPRHDVVIEFTPEDLNDVDEMSQRLSKALPGIIENISTTMADEILRKLKSGWSRELARQNRELAGFRQRLDVRATTRASLSGYGRNLVSFIVRARRWCDCVMENAR